MPNVPNVQSVQIKTPEPALERRTRERIDDLMKRIEDITYQVLRRDAPQLVATRSKAAAA